MPYPTCGGVCRRCGRAEHLEETVSFCGRVLTASELNLVRQIIADFPRLSQAELAYTICELLEWRRPNGCATQKWQIARIPFLWRVSECLDTLSTRRPPLMPNSLPELEAERSKLLRQFTTLGALRPGSICAAPRRCGKPTCHCAKPNDPGHDPQIRLTRKIDGKTVAESFPSPAAWRKAQSEIDEHHRFQQLSTELISVNEKICKHRPLESESSTWTPEEKKRLLRSLKRSPAK